MGTFSSDHGSDPTRVVAPGDTPEESANPTATQTASLPEAEATVVHRDAAGLDRLGQLQFERGDSIARYVVIGKLGAGAMGVVYSAYDPDLNRKVAIKVLRQPMAPDVEGSTGNRTMLREAQAMAQLSHANVLPVYDVGTARDCVFIATECIEGQTLKQWWGEKKRPWREILRAFIAAGQGLAAAHQAGLIHRDFKPHNVMVGDDGAVRVMDFGLARLAPDNSAFEPIDVLTTTGDDESGRTALGETFTVAGTVMGTPAYMAPEQHAGQLVSAAADQYSFCVALWEALHDARPFRATKDMSLAQAKQAQAIQSAPTDRHVPRWLKKILLRGMAPDPARRWPGMDDLLRALQRDPTRAWRTAAIVALAGLTVASGWVASGGGGPKAEPCGGAGEKIAEVWDAPLRQRLEASILATGRPHAPDTASKLSALVDRYAADWAGDRTTACRATRVHREQSEVVMERKLSCLDDSLEQVSTFLQALAISTTDNALNRATVEFERLASLELCRDVEALARPNEVPIPAGEEAIVDALATATSRLTGLVAAGALEETEKQAQRVDALLARVSHAPSRAQALWVRVSANELARRYDANRQILIEIRDLASRYDDKSLLSLVWSKSLWTVAVEERRMDAAKELVPVVESALTLARDEPHVDRLRKGARESMGAVELLAGNLAAAEQQYRAISEVDHFDTTAANNNLAVVLIYRGKIDQAREALARAERMLVKNASGLHPSAADIHLNRGLSYHWQGDLVAAEAWYWRAVNLGARVIGKDAPKMWLYRLYLGQVLVDRGQWKDARAQIEPALSGFAGAYGPATEFAVHARVQRVRIILGQGDVTAARAELAAVLADLQGDRLDQLTRGYTHPLQVDGTIALEEGDFDRARASFQHALDVYQGLYEPGSLQFVEPLIGLARADEAQGKLESARGLLTEARRLLQQGGSAPNDPRRARVAESLGRLRP